MAAPGRLVEDAAGVADGQGANSVAHRPADHGLRGFVLGLTDPPPMHTFDLVPAAPVPSPPPRPALAGFRGTGGHRPVAVPGIHEVLAVFGADRPPGDQQPDTVTASGRVRVDDTQINPGHPT